MASMASFELVEERPGDDRAVVALARLALGNRLDDSPAAAMRAGTRPLPGLSMVALEDRRPVATARCWPVVIGAGARAVQLGPVAVHPDRRGRGLAGQLIRRVLERAQAAGHRIAVLVGDPALYARYGFEPAARRAILLPRGEERERLQVLALVPGALDGLAGTVRPDSAASRPV